MTESFIYSDILQNIGWFNAGNPYKKLGDVNYVHYINGKVNIDKDTIIAYFPGCFAQFHDGHITVIDEMKHILSSVSDNYVIVLAPANTDYTVSKYGADNVYASNKYRYDRITSKLEGVTGNIAIDLNPMLNNDQDYNFTDLLKDFVERHVEKFDDLVNAPFIMCGKDRDYFKNIELLTNKIKIYYSHDITQLSSSQLIKESPKTFVKKICHLRCNNVEQLGVFHKYFKHHYKEIVPVYLKHELEQAKKKSEFADITICKEYADILPYVPFHRNFIHPLTSDNTYTGDASLIDNNKVLDSDIFTGGTAREIVRLGGCLTSVMNFYHKTDTDELVDFNDFYDEKYCYPYYDISERCSMMPFTKKDHENLAEFKQYINLYIPRT